MVIVKPELTRAFWLPGLCLALIIFNGCIATFEHPLTPVSEQFKDPDIIGTWIKAAKNEIGFIHIGKDEQTGKLLVVMTSFESDGKIDLSILTGHISKIKSGSYLNLKWVRPEKKNEKGYYLVKYRVEGSSLKLFSVDDRVIEHDIEQGVIEGKLEVTQAYVTVTKAYVTADSKALAQYISKNDTILFPEEDILIKDLKAYKKPGLSSRP